MTEFDEVRDQQRASWDRFAGGWERWDHVVLPMLAPIGDEMVRLVALRAGAEHLDVASGTGEPALTLAAAAPEARVVLTDLAAGMLAAAARAARRRGIDNVELRECSADDLPFPDGSFDSLTCRFGIMFVPDLHAAVAEFARVVRPGGTVCVAVWSGPDANPWATIPTAALATELDAPAPPMDAPGVFRCARPGQVSELFAAAGLSDVRELEVAGALRVGSADETWTYMTEVAAPLVAGLAQLDDAARERVRAAAVAALADFEVAGGVEIPLLARCIVATR